MADLGLLGGRSRANLADFSETSQANSGTLLAFLSVREGLNHLGLPQNTDLSPLRVELTPASHPRKIAIFGHFSVSLADLGLLGARSGANIADFRTRPRPIRGRFFQRPRGLKPPRITSKHRPFTPTGRFDPHQSPPQNAIFGHFSVILPDLGLWGRFWASFWPKIV